VSPSRLSSANIERVVAGNAANMLAVRSDLLAQAVTATASRRLDLEPAFFRPVAAVLVGALPGDRPAHRGRLSGAWFRQWSLASWSMF
jgi:hypothetical protein